MPQPTVRDVHVDVPLTNISVAYIQEAQNFIADKVFPVVPVQKQSGTYFVYEKGSWLRSVAEERAPGTESAGGGWTVDNTPSYYCRVYAVHKDVDDQTRANATAPIDLDRDATEWVTHQLLLKRELVFANSYLNTGVWSNEYAGVTGTPSAGEVVKWSDYTNSTPIQDITNAITAIARGTGYKPNVLVLAPDVFNALKNHPNIVERIKYTQKAVVTEDMIAGLFGVDKVLVPWAVVNTAEEGATDNVEFIISGKALLAYASPSPSLYKPSAGYTFVWIGLVGANAGVRIKKFRMEHLSADRVEGEMAFDMKVVASDLGALFHSLV